MGCINRSEKEARGLHGGSGLKKQQVTLPVEHRMLAYWQVSLGERLALQRDRNPSGNAGNPLYKGHLNESALPAQFGRQVVKPPARRILCV